MYRWIYADEILQLILNELNNPASFALLSKRHYEFTQDPYVRAMYFLARYGRIQALYWALGRGKLMSERMLDVRAPFHRSCFHSSPVPLPRRGSFMVCTLHTPEEPLYPFRHLVPGWRERGGGCTPRCHLRLCFARALRLCMRTPWRAHGRAHGACCGFWFLGVGGVGGVGSLQLQDPWTLPQDILMINACLRSDSSR